jgi:hypothetical protein
MLSIQNKKNRVVLSDYPYRKDITNRLFLESLSPFEIQVLQELLCLGTKFPLADLAESCSVSIDEVAKIVDKFSRSGLLMRQNEMLFVDKELRKYFEFQIATFDPTFVADLDYFQGLLTKVPISVLPAWYCIPKTSDNIFSSIVEKYLLTPKLYEKYLSELVFDEPLCNKIIDEVFSSPDFMLPAEVLRQRLTLSKEKLQECMLLLEFHFVLASSFVLVEDEWKEMISPFSEWHQYRLLLQNTVPKPIEHSCEIKSALNGEPPLPSFTQFRNTLDALHNQYGSSVGSIEKGYREIEKALGDIKSEGWILFDDFMKMATFALGSQEQITLRRRNKKWQYAVPAYNQEETSFIKQVIFELLVHAGITHTGQYNGKSCFQITAFGRISLERE